MINVEKRINIQQVAKESNVSVATVSRVLNNKGYVKKTTKERVEKTVKNLNYRRNAIAKSLRNSRSHYIALIVPDLENEYFAVLSRWIENALQSYGYGVFISSIEQSQEKGRWYAQLFVDHFVAGAIALTDNDVITTIFTNAQIPIVVADRIEEKNPHAHVSFIESDNYHGGYLAATELINRGASHLLLLRDVQNLTNVQERALGFLDAIKAAKNNIHYRILPQKVCRKTIYETIFAQYQQQPFNGLFATSDYLAIPALGGLLNHGVCVPKDVQIIGYDGTPAARYTAPPLATITQSLDKFGHKIATTIYQMINDNNYTINTIMPVYLQSGGTLLPPLNHRSKGVPYE